MHGWAKDFIHVIKNYHLLALKYLLFWPYSMRAYAFPLLNPGLHHPRQTPMVESFCLSKLQSNS